MIPVFNSLRNFLASQIIQKSLSPKVLNREATVTVITK